MSVHHSRRALAALLLTLALVFVTAVPALAEGDQGGGRFCFGDNLTLSSGQSVDSLLAFGCNVSVEQGATVRGDLVEFGGNIAIAGTVGGNIVTFGGNVGLADTAVVGGTISTMGGSVQRAAGATVQGGIRNNSGNFTPPNAPVPPIAPVTVGPFSRVFNFGFDILGGIVTALAFAALGALVVIFAPEPTRRIGNAVQAKPLNVAGVGCLTLILLPILGLLLVITLIGIPVALILGLASVIAWVFGWIAIGFLTGEKILQAFKARDILPVVAVIVGVLILTLISQVHFIGWLVSLVVGLLGIGAVVLTRFGTRAYPTPPTLMMTPAIATGPSVPGSYTPSSADIAKWEDKARQVQAANPPAEEPKPVDATPPEPKQEIPPGGTEETNPNA